MGRLKFWKNLIFEGGVGAGSGVNIKTKAIKKLVFS
jgi:hypothetical protein